MTVLDKIAASTRLRLKRQKAQTPEASLRGLAAARRPRDFLAPLRSPGVHVIAEVKLASPSEGELGRGLDPVEAARAYAANGAAAISVLTEPEFFRGDVSYLKSIRERVSLPLLMKDFLLEEYQLLQGRAFGADCVLLIAALLGDRLGTMLAAARALELSALVEVHDEPEMEAALACGARLIGVNNRNLKTLKVDLDVSRRLAPAGVKAGAVLVCESGISSGAQLREFAALGYRGFLVGSHLIKSGDPGRALAALLGEAR